MLPITGCIQGGWEFVVPSPHVEIKGHMILSQALRPPHFSIPQVPPSHPLAKCLLKYSPGLHADFTQTYLFIIAITSFPTIHFQNCSYYQNANTCHKLESDIRIRSIEQANKSYAYRAIYLQNDLLKEIHLRVPHFSK